MNSKRTFGQVSDGDTEANISKVKHLLRSLGASANKALGQNFLVDNNVLAGILDAARLSSEDTVIEVGPGFGVLTRALAERVSRVVAVEIDEGLASLLERSMGNRPQVRVIRGDILSEEPWTEVPAGLSYKVVANLPYNIASPTLRRFLKASHRPSMLVVMLQEEVAEEIAAKPGKMRLLSSMVQYFARAEIVATVCPESFFPRPKVNSAVLRLIPHDIPPVQVADIDSFFALIAAGFRQPRKQLANSLAQGLVIPTAQACEHLSVARIDPHRRAETLSLQEWADLWRAVYAEGVG